MGLPDLYPSAPKLALITFVVVPIVVPVGYLLYLDRLVSQNLTITTGVVRTPKRTNKSTGLTTTTTPATPTTPPLPITLPDELNLALINAETTPDNDTNDGFNTTWILAYERLTSHPIPLSLLPPLPPSDSPPDSPSYTPALTTYLRTTMSAFRSTPQAYLLHASVKHDAAAVRTFDRGFIAGLGFTLGDRVNGFWRVGYRGAGDGGVVGEWQGERVEMALDAPESYRGKRVEGVVVAGMERVPLSLSRSKDRDGEEDGVVFVNETWMWRREGEAPVLLESGFGRWFHVVMSGWLVMRGVKAVVGSEAHW
ncbi:uncharacterized protein C8A04DRAFT_14266 [Dichotomopilus funicola]|uniref:Uncharacterized protein n=1 Tax=Dichotomopilus funicola TaxID=1934379 RepID=A0AAN6UY25_9PEZI|nr:hypothetical protein C8A04DRAFT_14266 [Dichotomopilus funicola]